MYLVFADGALHGHFDTVQEAQKFAADEVAAKLGHDAEVLKIDGQSVSLHAAQAPEPDERPR